MSYVVDASIVAKWFIRESDSSQADRLLFAGATLAAPDLVLLEVGNALVRAVRGGSLVDLVLDDVFLRLRRLIPVLVPLSDCVAGGASVALQFGGTAWDGTYVHLARRRDAVLVTADLEMTKVARRAGVATRSPSDL